MSTESTWQPPVQNSVALENYLEGTKFELAPAVLRPQMDNISANERNPMNATAKLTFKKLLKEQQRPSSMLHKR